ncbi:hypothetical protein GCM10010912_66090 [Paenibacillus albidus]|uniref:HTH marR-type domain-containing protein n=1 Tax=Paenibacillus albidus TaxID=2041023 RepID=A0A917D6B2_9BACL|nr:MarR family transcriptional regulator [Paenibacillus albidus]GGG12430.1 hypothetical protein GCM10010912_66090 [Paenibacillus albidus]
MSHQSDKELAIHKVMNQLASAEQKSQAFVGRITRSESLTHNQIMLLFLLQLTGRLNITDIAERFIITPGAASSMCDKLEDLGLVVRVRTKEDRRVVNIELTDQGTQRILQLFDTFETAELDRMSAILRQINDLIAEIVD